MARELKTMDGATAAAHVAYAFSDVAAIYPITPSSAISNITDKWASENKKNIFDQCVKVVELQSEAGAAGTVHGSLVAGALTTTFTSSQGLLLMVPNMYKIAGELIPCVIHVASRTIASHALSIFGDHQDIYAVRQTGFAIMVSQNPQEVMDLSAVSHLSTLEARIPFINSFDGFRTSHEIQKIEVWDYKELKSMINMDALNDFRKRSLHPEHPNVRGTAQNDDVFFQYRESINKYYDKVPGIVQDYMDKVNKKLGTDYKLFNYYGASDAEHIIVAMGSVNDTIEETIDYLNAAGGKYGLIKVRLYRPFSKEHLISQIPDSVKTISVLDRTKEPGSIGEPLYLDVVAALKDSKFKDVSVFGGRYGLSSKNTTPSDINAIFENAKSSSPKPKFTISIIDDVSYLSLDVNEPIYTTPESTKGCIFWGLGSDGTVGANKNSIKIIGDNTDLFVQAYFAYDSKKSGGITTSHLRFGKDKIKSTYLVENADFVACHNASYMTKYDILSSLKKGGTFLLNCSWDMNEIENNLPGDVKSYIANNDIKFYIIDGVKIAKEVGLGARRINTILQSAFFKLVDIIEPEEAKRLMKDAATVSYSKKGDAIVAMNHKAIDEGMNQIVQVEIPESWKNAKGEIKRDVAVGEDEKLVSFVNDILIPVNARTGNKLPVSTFADRHDGVYPSGTAAFEKRGIAVDVPCWNSENCIQCNFCSYVCPHAVIRPVVVTEEEAKNAPKNMKFIDAVMMPGYKFGITVSVMDCTGCSSCANVCPGKAGKKALVMDPLENNVEEQESFNFAVKQKPKKEVFEKFKPTTVKGSQFKQPLLEFSGACAGCGETPYAKLATQLYGDRMYIANATGCSSIWGASDPSIPYTKNHEGRGPAWGNSLFEDNAEYGYGIFLAQKTIREKLIAKVEELLKTASGELKTACEQYLDTLHDGIKNAETSATLIFNLEKDNSDIAKEILLEKEFLSKKSMWLFGGDGWAYDIGYGGLDHVLASGEDINVLVFDTEVYSNTGGQSSKSTPLGATANFASLGKGIQKKDLASISMSYGYIYVAQVAMGADYNQCIKAFVEAERYNGPSLIIAYSPCIEHGIKGGMGSAQAQIKRAVEAGYWNIFRFDPSRKEQGLNPLQIDGKAPKSDFQDFIASEIRFSSLEKLDKDRAYALFKEAEAFAKQRYEKLQKLVQLYEV